MKRILINLFLIYISILFLWDTVLAEDTHKITETKCKNPIFSDNYINKLQQLNKIEFDKLFEKSGGYWYEKFHTTSVLDIDGDEYCDLIIEESTPFPDAPPSKRGWYLSFRLYKDTNNRQKKYEIELPPNKSLYYFNSYSVNNEKIPYIISRTSYYPNKSREALTILQWDSANKKWAQNTINPDKQLAIVKYYIQTQLANQKKEIINFLKILSKEKFKPVRDNISKRIKYYTVNDSIASKDDIIKMETKLLAVIQKFNFISELFVSLNSNNTSDGLVFPNASFNLNHYKSSLNTLELETNKINALLKKAENILFRNKIPADILNLDVFSPVRSLLSEIKGIKSKGSDSIENNIN